MMITLIKFIIVISVITFIFTGSFSVAQAQVMSSSNYQMQIDSLNVGGGRGTSASYQMEGTSGESATGRTTSTSHILHAGFQLPVVAATPSPSPTPAAEPGASQAGTRRAQGTLLNIENFTATPGDQQVQLRWTNPQDIDFLGVRIMRSEEFYPVDPSDGHLIYEDGGEQFSDVGLENGQPYYYTAFAYDRFGNFSSGAVAFATPFAPGDSFYPEPVEGPEPPLVPSDLIPEPLKHLSLRDFDFFQAGKKLSITNGRIEVDPDAPLTISIDYDKLPEVLKTILVTLKNENGELFSFLLRVDEEKTRYVATIRPPTSGLYPISFTVVDYQNQGLQKVQGDLNIKEALAAAVSPPGQKWWSNLWPEIVWFLLLALGLLLLFAIVRYMHKKLSENTNNQETRYKQYPITNYK